MVWLWILIGVLALLALILLLRVSVRIAYEEAWRITAAVGPVKLQVLPRPPRKPKREKKQRKAKEEKPPAEKNAPGFTAAELRSALPVLFAALKRALGKTRRRLRIDPMRLSVTFAGEDPAKVAETYGWAQSAMWTVMPQLEELTRMPDPRIHLETDYNSLQTRATGEIGLSLRVGDLLGIGLTFGVPVLRWYLALQKERAAKEKAADEEKRELQNKGV